MRGLTSEPRDDTAHRRPRRAPRWLAPVLVAAAFFGAIAPTLPWLEFAGGSENLVVETVLEMRRGGPWFIPTLQGLPRLSKPPLAAWITAAAARPQTVERLSTRDPDARAAAYRQFAWQVRWPTLLCACAMLVATYALGDLLLGRPVGLVAALACGSSLLFLRFCRGATTDVQIALWVTAGNAFLALALLRRRYWPGFLGAGLALGLSMMSKGPVGLAQSVLPVALFLWWRPRGARDSASAGARRGALVPALAGLAVMLAVALPWPLTVAHRYPGIWTAWYREITREGATQLAPDPWYYYFVFPAWMLPWLAFLAAGTWLASVALFRRTPAIADSPLAPSPHPPKLFPQGMVLALLLTFVPIVVMSFAKDKVERYLLPMAAPAAVLAAGALVDWFRSDRRDPRGRLVEAIHWATLIVFALAPGVIALSPQTFGIDDGKFDPRSTLAFGAAALLLLGVNVLAARRTPSPGTPGEGRGEGSSSSIGNRQSPIGNPQDPHPNPLPEYRARGRDGVAAVRAAVLTAAIVLLLQYPVMRGYSRMSVSDLRPLADAVWAQYPDALLYEYEPGTRTRTYLDLPIYAGRLSHKVNDPAALAPKDRPQVVVFFNRHGDPPPLGPTWKEIASGGGRKDGWRAFVLPPAR